MFLRSLDDSAGDIVGITNLASTNLFDQTAQIHTEAHAVFVNFGGVTGIGPGDGTLSFDIVVAPAIPEPSSMALLAEGLGAMGLAIRRRKRTAA